jgi:hypothetical protein
MAPELGKPIHQLPLVPANVLKKHHVHEPLDTRFRSAPRLLQALWREDRDLLWREPQKRARGRLSLGSSGSIRSGGGFVHGATITRSLVATSILWRTPKRRLRPLQRG